MKRCPKCGQAYADPDLNFCLNDGELLTQMQESPYGASASHPFADDAPPTVMMNDPRATNPTGWTGGSSPAPYQNTPPAYQAPQFGMANLPRSLDQTLPTVSLVLGIVPHFCLLLWRALVGNTGSHRGVHRNAKCRPRPYSIWRSRARDRWYDTWRRYPRDVHYYIGARDRRERTPALIGNIRRVSIIIPTDACNS